MTGESKLFYGSYNRPYDRFPQPFLLKQIKLQRVNRIYKAYENIEVWRNRPIEGQYPYVYLDAIVLKRSWASEVRNISMLAAIGVRGDGFRKVLGTAEGEKEDKAGWSNFLAHLKSRRVKGIKLFISDA